MPYREIKRERKEGVLHARKCGKKAVCFIFYWPSPAGKSGQHTSRKNVQRQCDHYIEKMHMRASLCAYVSMQTKREIAFVSQIGMAKTQRAKSAISKISCISCRLAAALINHCDNHYSNLILALRPKAFS